MKKYLSILFFSFLIINISWSQKSLLKFNIYKFIDEGNPDFYYEYIINEANSVDAIFGLGFGNSPFSNSLSVNVNIQAAYRRYLLPQWKPAPIGFFVRPVIGYRNFNNSYSGITYKYSTFLLGATAGFQYTFKERFAIDLFAGPVYHLGTNKETPNEFETFINIGLGYGF